MKTIQTATAKPRAADAPDSRKEETMNNDKLTILYEKLSHEDGRENESLSITDGKTSAIYGSLVLCTALPLKRYTKRDKMPGQHGKAGN